MAEAVELEYYLPPVGMLRPELYGEAVEIYRSMERGGLIGHYRSSYQLGAVSSAWESARHTRWDYIVLTLDLIRRSKSLDGVPVGSAVKLSKSVTFSSGRALLSCWALMLYAGHLAWSFDAERLLLHLLLEDVHRGQRDELADRMPSRSLKVWAQTTMRREETFHFYKVLSVEHLMREDLANSNVDWQTAFEAYLNPSGKAASLKNHYQRMRRLAFLSLDAQYSPSVISVNLPRLLSDERSLSRLISPAGHEQSSDELSGLEAYLAEHVYQGREVSGVLASSIPQLREKIQRALSEHGLSYTIGELRQRSYVDAVVPRRPLEHVLSVNVGDSIFEVEQRRVPSVRQLDRDARSFFGDEYYSAELVIFDSPGTDGLRIHGHSSSAHVVSKARLCAYTQLVLGQCLRACHPARGEEPPYVGAMSVEATQRNAQALLVAVLDVMTDGRFVWDWSRGTGRALGALMGHKSRIQRYARQAAETLNDSSRAHEFRETIRRIRWLPSGPIVVSLSGVTAVDREGLERAQLDGVLFSVDRSREQLVLTIVEAKSQSRRAEQTARDDLAEKLGRLEPESLVRAGRMTSEARGRYASAWVHLRVPYAVGGMTSSETHA